MKQQTITEHLIEVIGGTSLTLATLQSRVDAFIAAVNSTIP